MGASGDYLLSVTNFPDVSDARAGEISRDLGAVPLRGPLMLHDWEIQLPPDRFADLLGADEVAWVEEIEPPAHDKLDGIRANMHVDQVRAGFGLYGTDIVAGQWESGHADITTPGGAQNGHDDFYSARGDGPCRITVVEGLTTAHGTRVAGVLMGSGFRSQAEGGAPYQIEVIHRDGTAETWTQIVPARRLGSAVAEIALRLTSPTPLQASQGIRFTYELPAGGPVEVFLTDVTGRRIATLVRTESPAGSYTASWAGDDAAECRRQESPSGTARGGAPSGPA